jgi:hypothetical protein
LDLFPATARNESANTSHFRQEMEPTAVAAHTPLPQIATLDTDGVNLALNQYSGFAAVHSPSAMNDETNNTTDPLFIDPPAPRAVLDHAQSSNVRDNHDPTPDFTNIADLPPTLPLDPANPTLLDTATVMEQFDSLPTAAQVERYEENVQMIKDAHDWNQDQGQPLTRRAFAKLAFDDGDYYVETFQVIIGRNDAYFRDFKRRQKEARNAQNDLESYRQEPSQPSQPGDENLQANGSYSSHSLEGRPAPPSTPSAVGGVVYYPQDSEEQIGRGRRARRRRSMQMSSSTTSVAPASLSSLYTQCKQKISSKSEEST